VGTSDVTVPYQLVVNAPRRTYQVASAEPSAAGRTLVLALVAALVILAGVLFPLRTGVAEALGRPLTSPPAPASEELVSVADPGPDLAESNPARGVDAAMAFAAGRGLVGLAVLDRLTGPTSTTAPMRTLPWAPRR